MKANPYSLVKAGVGLATTGKYIYDLYKNSGKIPDVGQYDSKSLSRIPNKYLTSRAQMAKKSYSYSPSKTKYRKKKIRYLRKKFIKKRKYKTKKFSKFLNKVVTTTNPYQIQNVEDYRSIVSSANPAAGNSTIFGIDVGMCRFSITGPDTGNWTATIDDLSQCIVEASQGTVTTVGGANNYAQDLHIDKLGAIACLRNNSNIGISMEAFYVSPRKSQASQAQSNSSIYIEDRMIAGMNASYNPPVIDAVQQMGYSENFFDYPNLCSRFKLKRLKKFILYPAQTKFFKISSPAQGKTHNIANLSMRSSDPRYHRSLIFLCKGLPVHSDATADFTSGPVAYGPFKLDVIISRKIKYRLIDERSQDNAKVIGSTRIPVILPANAEIQPAVNPGNSLVTS